MFLNDTQIYRTSSSYSLLSPNIIIMPRGVHGVVNIFKQASLALGLALAAFLSGGNGYGGADKQLALIENIIFVQGRNLISLQDRNLISLFHI